MTYWGQEGTGYVKVREGTIVSSSKCFLNYTWSEWRNVSFSHLFIFQFHSWYKEVKMIRDLKQQYYRNWYRLIHIRPDKTVRLIDSSCLQMIFFLLLFSAVKSCLVINIHSHESLIGNNIVLLLSPEWKKSKHKF